MAFLCRTLLAAGLVGLVMHGAWAHEDRILSLKRGEIEGLPAEYKPATFEVETGKLRIGKREVTLSPFAATIFPGEGPYDLEIKASWYHDKEIMPYYISFKITPKGRDFSYNLLLNLETLELMKVSVELRESENVTRELDVVPNSGGTTRVISGNSGSEPLPGKKE